MLKSLAQWVWVALAVGGMITLILLGMDRVLIANGVTLSKLAKTLIGTAAVVGLGATLYRWYPLFNTRPSNIPRWNDIYHRPWSRFCHALGTASAVAAAVAGLMYVSVLALLPKGGDSSGIQTVRSVAYFIEFDGSGYQRRCSRIVHLADADGDHRYCICSSWPSRICLREFDTSVAYGQQVDLLVRTNWAGTAIVGIRPHVG